MGDRKSSAQPALACLKRLRSRVTRAVVLVRADALPRHIAIIMDGNGRWAQRLGRPRTEGHREGSEAVRRVVRASRRLGIQGLTLYAFSEQNWQRPVGEVHALMDLFREFLISEREEVLRTGIRVKAVGRLQRLPGALRRTLDQLVRDTAHCTGMTLQLAVSYGGREEIVDAARRLALRIADGSLNPDALDEACFDAELPSAGAGAVDLLIRTGGERRISNFLLWGAAYAELHFSNTLWPEFTEHDLYEAIASYQLRERRFGLVPTASDTANSGLQTEVADTEDARISSPGAV